MAVRFLFAVIRISGHFRRRLQEVLSAVRSECMRWHRGTAIAALHALRHFLIRLRMEYRVERKQEAVV